MPEGVYGPRGEGDLRAKRMGIWAEIRSLGAQRRGLDARKRCQMVKRWGLGAKRRGL